MIDKIRIVLFVVCAVFSHTLLAIDYVLAQLFTEPLEIRVDDVAVRLEYNGDVTTLVIPAVNRRVSSVPAESRLPDSAINGAVAVSDKSRKPEKSRKKQHSGSDDGALVPRKVAKTRYSSFYASRANGVCEQEPCNVVRQLHSIQQFLVSNSITELRLRLNPLTQSSSSTTYSDKHASYGYSYSGKYVPYVSLSHSTDDMVSATLVLNLSFTRGGQTLSVDLPYSISRISHSVDWQWGRRFFNAHYMMGEHRHTRFFDPLQESVLSSVMEALNRLTTIEFSRNLCQFPPEGPVDYDPCLFGRERQWVGGDSFQPLERVRTIENDSEGQPRGVVSSITSGQIRYSIRLPPFDSLSQFPPVIELSHLPPLSQQTAFHTGGVVVGITAVIVLIVAGVLQASGNYFW